MIRHDKLHVVTIHLVDVIAGKVCVLCNSVS